MESRRTAPLGLRLFQYNGGITMEERTLPLLTAAQARSSRPQERYDLDDLIFQGEHWTVSER